MPKIIENLETRLMEEAQRQIESVGYTATTIRSVAKSCGVGVGTVYNYFPSKDALIAAFMLEDWNKCLAAIVAQASADPRDLCLCIHRQLKEFSLLNQVLFRDQAAVASFSAASARYHGLLRSQLAKPLEPFCGSGFPGEFIAEALLVWTMAGKEFDEIYGMIGKLF